MRLRSLALACAALALVAARADAAATFSATGVLGVSGYVTFDDSSFDGSSFQFLPNTTITALSLTVFGETYTLADVALGDSTIIDSSGAIPIIVNGAGNLADNGTQSISFFPDGWDGTSLDGDASLGIGAGGAFADDRFFAVQWVFGDLQVPEPTGLALLGLGLAGLGWSRRRAAGR